MSGYSYVKPMKSRLRATISSVLFVPFLVVSQADSHPHVFLETALTIVFDQEALTGIRVKWLFDEMFSSMIAFDFDLDQDQKLEKNEIALIRENAFSNLKNFGYFTSIKIDGKPFKVESVRDFSAALVENQLVYEFLIPCHVKATTRHKEFRISQYDRGYYTAVSFTKEQPLMFEGTSDFELEHRIAENVKQSYYFGQIIPEELIIKFRLKDG